MADTTREPDERSEPEKAYELVPDDETGGPDPDRPASDRPDSEESGSDGPGSGPRGGSGAEEGEGSEAPARKPEPERAKVRVREEPIGLEPEPEEEGKPEGAPRGSAPDEGELFVKPGVGSVKVMSILGGVLLLAALVAAGIRAGSSDASTPGGVALVVVVALYQVLLHTCTGVLAVMIGARVMRRRFAQPELVAARMLTAVSAFVLVANIAVPIPGRVDEWVLATLVYVGAVWLLLRLPRMETMMVIVIHALIGLAILLGTALEGARAPGAGGG